jgi:hemerythrin-like domain-containing protein
MQAELELARRTGLPAEFRAGLELYPREVWSDHAHLGMTARFWLARHDAFRELGGSILAGLDDFREGRTERDAFVPWLVPRLRHFLSDLQGHHQIEDLHYFPVFVAAEPRLVAGFELLENDHETIHGWIGSVVETANVFLSTAEADASAQQAVADRHGEASRQLIEGLMRHLADEEDLIMPVILDRTEERLGL